jgi:hypothetical protein
MFHNLNRKPDYNSTMRNKFLPESRQCNAGFMGVTADFKENNRNSFGPLFRIAQFVHLLSKEIAERPRCVGPVVAPVENVKATNSFRKIETGVFEAAKKIANLIAAKRPRITVSNIGIDKAIAGVDQVGNTLRRHVESPLAVCGETI